jgi:tRNA dimethylallyltransferase
VALVSHRLVGIVGPTASGKSALALDLARRWGGEIVSCDSLQVYRGLDIGSAKPTPDERALVPHHLIDVVDPDEDFSAADYARRARVALKDVSRRGRLPIVVGGTGLYLRALIEGLFAGPSRNDRLRARLDSMATRFGAQRLHRVLRRVDGAAAERVQVRDRVRIVRALEVFFLTGRPLSEQQGRGGQALEGYQVRLVGLEPGRAALRRRVELRTAAMLDQGLIEETQALIRKGLGGHRPLRAIGYRQAVAVIEGHLTLAEAQAAIVRDTMRYAKRQMTWFRHQADVHWCATAADARRWVSGWLESRQDDPV